MSRRTDTEGYSTKVTALGKGYGCRVFKDDRIVAEGWADSKLKVAPVLRELLRMLDKCGNPSSMASASRVRNYTRHQRPPILGMSGASCRPWTHK